MNTVNEKRTHLISCAGLDAEHIRTATEKSIDVTYALHVVLRHEGDAVLEKIAWQL